MEEKMENNKELYSIIKKIIKEALREYFIDIWEREEPPFPPPPPYWYHPKYREYYIKDYKHFKHNLEQFDSSVEKLSFFVSKLEAVDWGAECSEKDKIQKLVDSVSSIEQNLKNLLELLNRNEKS